MQTGAKAGTTDVYQQVIPEGVADTVNSIHGELRKPSTAAEKTRKIAANLRAKKQRRIVHQNAKSTPIDTKSLTEDSGGVGIST